MTSKAARRPADDAIHFHRAGCGDAVERAALAAGGNYLGDVPVSEPLEESDKPPNPLSPMLSEDDVKRRLRAWLEASGWQVSVADR